MRDLTPGMIPNNASALATTLESAAVNDQANLARIQSSVSGDRVRAQLVGAHKIRKLLGDIARAGTDRITLLMHSHSIGQGAGCNSETGGTATYNAAYQTAAMTRSWGAQLAKRLSVAAGGVGSSCLQPMTGIGASTVNPLFTTTSPYGTTSALGTGGYRLALTSPTATATFTAVGSSIQVYGVAGAPGTTARWSAPSVSAGATQTATTSAGSLATPDGGAFWYAFTIAGVAPGETVTLIGPASGVVVLHHVDLDYRTDPGVSVHRMCLSGAALVQIHASAIDNTDTTGPSWIGSTTGQQNLRAGHAYSMTDMIPSHGVIGMTDVNDLNTWSTATGSNWGYDLEDHQRHLANYLAYHAARNLQVIWILGPIRDPAFQPGDRPYDQAQLIEALKTTVNAAPNAAYIDLTAPFTGATMTDRWTGEAPYMFDFAHPGRRGHAKFANTVADAILLADI